MSGSSWPASPDRLTSRPRRSCRPCSLPMSRSEGRGAVTGTVRKRLLPRQHLSFPAARPVGPPLPPVQSLAWPAGDSPFWPAAGPAWPLLGRTNLGGATYLADQQLIGGD